MTPKRPKFSTQKLPDKGKTQLLSQVSQIFFGKSLSTSLNILGFHFLKVCVVCVKFIFLSPSLKFYWRIHCKPKKPNFFNLGPLCLPTPVGLSKIGWTMALRRSIKSWSLEFEVYRSIFVNHFFFIWAVCSESYSVATGEACDCSGNSCTDAEFCYDGACNSNARGIP